jgi:hypothetical protein
MNNNFIIDCKYCEPTRSIRMKKIADYEWRPFELDGETVHQHILLAENIAQKGNMQETEQK